MKYLSTAIFTFGLSASAALAAPVDLSTWTAENGPSGPGGSSNGDWDLAVDNNSVTQGNNGRPTVFYDGASSSQGTALSGSITVNTTGDDDFVGFILGMDAGELDGTAATVDYWLVDWKQTNQTVSGNFGEAGLALTHVTAAATSQLNFWSHEGPGFDEVARGTNLGSTGWDDLVEYTFELVFTDSLIEIAVNGATELSYTSAQNGSSFEDGGFGFYNYSQQNVTYAGITEVILPDPDPDPDPNPNPSAVPFPAGLPRLLAGLGAFGVLRRKAKT